MVSLVSLGGDATHGGVGVASPVPRARDFGDGVLRLPIQLVEATLLFVLLAGLHALHVAGKLPDRRLFVFFAAYGSLRFALEFWREPVASVSAGIGFYQWLALLLAGVGLWQIAKRTRLQEEAA
jgi:prolipoprotein diacylglyceryltransferase